MSSPARQAYASLGLGSGLSQPTRVLEQALVLLEKTRHGIADPEHWCKEDWARDAAGTPIVGATIPAIVASERAAARCLMGELVYWGLQNGYRIEFSPVDEPVEVLRAPETWMLLAAEVLAVASAAVLITSQLIEPHEGEARSVEHTRGQVAMASLALNERAAHDHAVLAIRNAVLLLQRELDQRDHERGR